MVSLLGQIFKEPTVGKKISPRNNNVADTAD
jgi:hypothetical protein